MDLVLAARHLLRDLRLFSMARVVDVGLVAEEIRDTVQVLLVTDR